MRGVSSGFHKISNHEKESLHREAQQVIKSYADASNPDLSIVPYTEASEGQNYLSCRVKGVSRIRLSELLEHLTSEFPGCDMYLEASNYPLNLFLELPIVVSQQDHPQDDMYYRPSRSRQSSKPSTEWGMFLFMVMMINLVVLWYRFRVGVSGF